MASGDRVGIGLYNSIEYIESLLAAFKMRAVPFNLNYRYRSGELADVLALTSASAVVYDGTLSERIATVAQRMPGLRALIEVGEGSERPPRATTFADAVLGPAQERRHRGPGDQVVLLTGGTTGRPKGVVWDHAGVIGAVSSVYRRVGLDPPADRSAVLAAAAAAVDEGTAPVMLPASPLMHGTGFFFSLGNLLLAGRVVLLVGRSFDPAEAWSAVQRHRVHELAIVGDAFGRPLLAELERAVAAGTPYDLSSLRRVVSSGVPWSRDIKEGFLRAGQMTLQDSIAATEGGPFGGAMSGPGAGRVTTRFMLGPGARVLRPDGTDVTHGSGEVGELAATGSLPLGYLDDPEGTAAVFRTIGGVRYAVPGDAARVEADGTLTLLGRGSGVVNTGGEKVFAEEVEAVLVGHPDVEEAVVVGVPDPRWGSRVTALVRAAPGKLPSPEALSTYVGRTLAGYKRPRQVVVVPRIERTPAGKIDRRWAQQRALEASGGREPP